MLNVNRIWFIQVDTNAIRIISFVKMENVWNHIWLVMGKIIVEIIVTKPMGVSVRQIILHCYNNLHSTSILDLCLWFIISYDDYYFIAATCRIGEFTCNNKNCINHNLTCDSHNNCGDWSDEAGCRGAFWFFSFHYI